MGVDGHGYVIARPDGWKAPCGGPAGHCHACLTEWFEKYGAVYPAVEIQKSGPVDEELRK